jgi:hypothetical protein
VLFVHINSWNARTIMKSEYMTLRRLQTHKRTLISPHKARHRPRTCHKCAIAMGVHLSTCCVAPTPTLVKGCSNLPRQDVHFRFSRVGALPLHTSTTHLTETQDGSQYRHVSVHHLVVHLGYGVTTPQAFAASAHHPPWSSLKSSCFSRPETDASVHPLARCKICSPCIGAPPA